MWRTIQYAQDQRLPAPVKSWFPNKCLPIKSWDNPLGLNSLFLKKHLCLTFTWNRDKTATEKGPSYHPPALCLCLSDCKEINSSSKNMHHIEFHLPWKKQHPLWWERKTSECLPYRKKKKKEKKAYGSWIITEEWTVLAINLGDYLKKFSGPEKTLGYVVTQWKYLRKWLDLAHTDQPC